MVAFLATVFFGGAALEATGLGAAGLAGAGAGATFLAVLVAFLATGLAVFFTGTFFLGAAFLERALLPPELFALAEAAEAGAAIVAFAARATRALGLRGTMGAGPDFLTAPFLGGGTGVVAVLRAGTAGVGGVDGFAPFFPVVEMAFLLLAAGVFAPFLVGVPLLADFPRASVELFTLVEGVIPFFFSADFSAVACVFCCLEAGVSPLLLLMEDRRERLPKADGVLARGVVEARLLPEAPTFLPPEEARGIGSEGVLLLLPFQGDKKPSTCAHA